MAELRRKRNAVRGADLVELRLDGVRDVSVAGAPGAGAHAQERPV